MALRRNSVRLVCEVQSVIRFLNAKNVFLLEIHRQIVEVHGEGELNEGNLGKCCQLLKQDRD
jgi:hypothetical protein